MCIRDRYQRRVHGHMSPGPGLGLQRREPISPTFSALNRGQGQTSAPYLVSQPKVTSLNNIPSFVPDVRSISPKRASINETTKAKRPDFVPRKAINLDTAIEPKGTEIEQRRPMSTKASGNPGPIAKIFDDYQATSRKISWDEEKAKPRLGQPGWISPSRQIAEDVNKLEESSRNHESTQYPSFRKGSSDSLTGDGSAHMRKISNTKNGELNGVSLPIQEGNSPIRSSPMVEWLRQTTAPTNPQEVRRTARPIFK
eukprot:TRINITY_DN8849_c0_g1_i1.p1 TRINITY_DN8849_c0_g1~~TRINITY_DN8849_c0_g1_i1.p1  ORF type:complete len:275 (-),score=36.67 TRINITY_DN8849_c0_g1_i1:134-898(-)